MKYFAKTFLSILITFMSFWIIITAQAQEWWTDNTNCPWGICTDVTRLANWTSKMDIYKTLWMGHKSKGTDWETSVMTFIQDIIYAATRFIWTVVTVALIVSGLFYIFSWADSSLRNKAKSWIKYALIWLVLVSASILIVRTVQFLAQGWS